MSPLPSKCPARVLLVEDNEADVRLTREALREAVEDVRLSAVGDGEQAMRYLRREGGFADAPRPDLVLLDLNLPRKNGLEVLDEMQADRSLASIPVIVLTSSAARQDVEACYAHGANAFVVKPLELDAFMDLIGAIRGFWLGVAQLPSA
ncbi:MAG TPA: response regulator [Solirubrobacteraceae bacterium]|nr:response regulator [Solirubrobacteraceae bacterium]